MNKRLGVFSLLRNPSVGYRAMLESPAHLAEFLNEGHDKSQDSGLVMLIVGQPVYTDVLQQSWWTDLMEKEDFYDNLILGYVGYVHGVPLIYRASNSTGLSFHKAGFYLYPL